MDSIHLLGAEEVTRASSRIESAAEQFSRAALGQQEALQQHQRFLDDWLLRLEEVMKLERKKS